MIAQFFGIALDFSMALLLGYLLAKDPDLRRWRGWCKLFSHKWVLSYRTAHGLFPDGTDGRRLIEARTYCSRCNFIHKDYTSEAPLV